MTDDIRVINVDITGPAGLLEGLINAKSGGEPRAIAVLAHPLPTAGGTMHTKAVFHAAKALARIDVPVLRFNFRGVGRSAGSFSEGPGEQDDFRAALAFMKARYPDVKRVWCGRHVVRIVGGDDCRRRGSGRDGARRHRAARNEYDYSPVGHCGESRRSSFMASTTSWFR